MFIKVSNLLDIQESYLNGFDAFIIDEVQFFKDITKFVNYWSSKGKYIICAGLNSDYKMEEFKKIIDSIPKIDLEVEYISLQDSFNRVNKILEGLYGKEIIW